MKSSLWMIIALVTGIVGFLVGYSVSGFTGQRAAGQIGAHGAATSDGPPAGAAAKAPDHGARAGGYGGGAPAPAAGGYGGAAAAQPATQKVASEKPKAAGY